MNSVGVRDLKARASEILRDVRDRRAGYTVTYRGRTVGVILPLDEAPPTQGVDEDPWEDLIRLGEEIGRDGNLH